MKRLQEDRLIHVRSMDDLIICNYTEKCAYDAVWDDGTMACRGLILRVDKPWPDSTKHTEVVALPWSKFWNAGERDLWPSGTLVNVTEKVDGSLGILYRHNGAYRIATRGTFDSEQAIWATEFLKRFNLPGQSVPESWTFLFEIVYPNNRIVVDYGDREDLVLLGIRNRYSGNDFGYDAVRRMGYTLGLNVVPTHDLTTLDSVLAAAKTLEPNAEGWVLRYDDGSRWKVKGTAYREISRLIAFATRAHVIEAMISGDIEEWLGTIPEEYRDDVIGWKKEAETHSRDEMARLTTILADGPTASRKDFALWAKANHPDDMPYLFALLDGKDIRTMILKGMLK